jgi:hypothetical protein
MVNAAVAVARRESLAGNQENFLRVRRLPANAFFRSPAAFRDSPPARSAVSTPCAVDEPLHQPSPGRTRRGTHRMEEMHRECVVAPVGRSSRTRRPDCRSARTMGRRHVATVVGFTPCGPACRSTVSPGGSRFMGVVAPAPRRRRRIRWRRGRRREPARRGATRGTCALPATLLPRRERLNQGTLLLCDRCGSTTKQAIIGSWPGPRPTRVPWLPSIA